MIDELLVVKKGSVACIAEIFRLNRKVKLYVSINGH